MPWRIKIYDYKVAVIPIINNRDTFTAAKELGLGYQEPGEYVDITMPRNAVTGPVLGALSFAMAFGLVWHIWWLVATLVLGATFPGSRCMTSWRCWPKAAHPITIGVFALAQMIVHFRFFLHIGFQHKREDLQLILFSALLLFIMVAGTIWIMASLAIRMSMPT